MPLGAAAHTTHGCHSRRNLVDCHEYASYGDLKNCIPGISKVTLNFSRCPIVQDKKRNILI